MKRVVVLISLLLAVLLSGCGTLYPAQTFTLENSSDVSKETVEFPSGEPSFEKYENNNEHIAFAKSKAANAQDLCVYGNIVYFVDGLYRLRQYALSDFDLKATDKVVFGKEEDILRVCTDPLCGDDSPEGILSCPAFLYSPDSRYLIDAHESGGGFPVFYFSRAVSSSFNENEFEGGNDFITLGNYAIFHYDVASNERKAVVSQNDPIVDFAVFGDRIFFVSSDKDGKYKVVIADKSGKIKFETTAVKSRIDLIGTEDETLYYADLAGNVYAFSLENGKDRLVYTVSPFVLLNTEANSSRMFVYNGYLYFDSSLEYIDTQIVDAYGTTQTYNLPVRTISRIALDQTDAEPQVVAENIFQSSVHGVCDGKLYYCKLTPGANMQNGYFNFCGGDIWALDLMTLKTTLFAHDIGMQFDLGMNYFSVRFCVGLMAAYSDQYEDMYKGKTSGSKFRCCLYDFETRQVYVLPVK